MVETSVTQLARVASRYRTNERTTREDRGYMGHFWRFICSNVSRRSNSSPLRGAIYYWNHSIIRHHNNHKKSWEIIRNHIKSSQSRLQSLIFNLHEEGLKSHETPLKSYGNDSNHMKFTGITQNYVQSMIP